MALVADDRVIKESGLEARIAQIASPLIEDMGFRLVRVRLSGREGLTVQIMAERPDGEITVEECADISRDLSVVLDVEDPIDRAYHLEISSPGVDRPLVREEDFTRWIGHEVRVEMNRIIDNRRRFKGKILSFEDNIVTIEHINSEGVRSVTELPLRDMIEARLIMTDDLVRDALRAAKAARKQAAKASKTPNEA